MWTKLHSSFGNGPSICRHLAKSQFDERLRLILKTIADEFDQQASDADTTSDGLPDKS